MPVSGEVKTALCKNIEYTSVEELEMVKQEPLRPELAMPPSEEELESAVDVGGLVGNWASS